jgi:hypothetical protein
MPEEHTIGSTPDISTYAMFDWYQIVEYLTPVNKYPEQKQTLGRWIGISENCIDEMASVIVTEKGLVIIRKSIWGLSDDDLSNWVKITVIALMYEHINSKINTSIESVLPLPPKKRTYSILRMMN